ncbi:MAG: hypothetical protein OXD40_01710 [bacterium]|nr:hypothetical protein [bacterium]
MVTVQDSVEDLLAGEASSRVSRNGDCLRTRTVRGHRIARELDRPVGDDIAWELEIIELAPEVRNPAEDYA